MLRIFYDKLGFDPEENTISAHEWANFRKSRPWKYIEKIIIEKMLVHIEEQQNFDNDPKVDNQLKGGIRACKDIISLPKVLHEDSLREQEIEEDTK